MVINITARPSTHKQPKDNVYAVFIKKNILENVEHLICARYDSRLSPDRL